VTFIYLYASLFWDFTCVDSIQNVTTQRKARASILRFNLSIHFLHYNPNITWKKGSGMHTCNNWVPPPCCHTPPWSCDAEWSSYPGL